MLLLVQIDDSPCSVASLQGDDANLRFVLLMPVVQVFIAKRALKMTVPVTKIYLPNVTTKMTIIMALMCSK